MKYLQNLAPRKYKDLVSKERTNLLLEQCLKILLNPHYPSNTIHFHSVDEDSIPRNCRQNYESWTKIRETWYLSPILFIRYDIRVQKKKQRVNPKVLVRKSIKFYKKLHKYIIDNIVSLKKDKRLIDLEENQLKR